VRRGELWWGAPSIPGEERKRRPFLVVSTDAFNANETYSKILVVHLTTVRRAAGPYSWEVEVPRGVGGMPRASTAKCAEVYTLFKRDLEERIGTLPQEAMGRVDRAVCVALGVDVPVQAERSG
jgi:mRNA-degrading endonuclease toxin of MazEF toxin-antitoxin module